MQIQKLRLERGWSQEQLAQAAGLSVRTVQRLERGRPGSLETLNAVAAAFDLDISCLRAPEMETERAPLPSSSLAFAALILTLLSFASALLLPLASILFAIAGAMTASVSVLRGRDKVVAYSALILSFLILTFVLYTQLPLGGFGLTARVTRAAAEVDREQGAVRP
jgi:transcriptional regulator with XRE-family HTH domain